MELKTLLVCLTSQEDADTLMKLAVPLARAHDAHLIGLYPIDPIIVYPGVAMHIPEPAFAALSENQKAREVAITDIFAHHTQSEDFPSEFRIVHADTMSTTERLVESARAADVVIMARGDKDKDPYDVRQARINVIRDSGRPVIMVPPGYEGPTPGQNILLGWSDTREATRAAHDLLCVAKPDADVMVLRVGGGAHTALSDFDGMDISAMLARHGLKPNLEHRDPHGTGIADVLSQVAFEKGSDLIVTGAFGHSKAYDFVIGATTHALLDTARVPVMFSK